MGWVEIEVHDIMYGMIHISEAGVVDVAWHDLSCVYGWVLMKLLCVVGFM